MFDGLRQSLRDVLAGAASPAERRAGLARMKETLVLARMGLDDLRTGIGETGARVVAERRELETVRRRKGLAAGIGDAETVGIAERYERQHADRVAVLERKLEAQERELALAEAEVAGMGAELKAALAGVPPAGGVPDSRAPDMPDERTAAEQELDALGRARRRAAHEAAAEDRLAALKRRMGK